MSREKVKCPKCGSTSNKIVGSRGGFCIYSSLKCNDCRFEGGTVRVYEGEEEYVKKEIIKRFSMERQDDVESFCSGIIG